MSLARASTRFLAAAALGLSATLVLAAGGAPSLPEVKVDPDYRKAEQAIDAKDWTGAIALLELAASRDANNADIHNYLGYAERKRGNLDAAFKHYDKALQINPKHRGAHEYAGEAWLLAGNLPKAEEHLAVLDRLCFLPCSEYRELKEKVGEYRQKASASGAVNQ